MYHIIENNIQCSVCGSEHYEGVTQGNDRFIRCRSCGHEGPRSQIIPHDSGPSLIENAYRSQQNQVRKF